MSSTYSQPKAQRPQIQLPTTGRPESVFATKLGQIIGPTEQLFRYDDRLVEVIEEDFSGQYDRFKLARGGLKFETLSPMRARTWFEQYAETGIYKTDPNTGARVFMAKTMSETVSHSMTVSPQFLVHTPRVWRILDVPIPVRTIQGDIVTPKAGFNRDLGIFCNPKIPTLKQMPIEQARELLQKTYEGFCWKNDQSKVHAFARLFTPYARGLIGFNERIPCWFFVGNRPRCGKDYLNGVTQILYLGNHFEDQPLGKNSEETAKRIVAALRAGRRMMHFANCQNCLDDSAFIQAITGPVLNARSLGATDAKSDLELLNEIDYSLSAQIRLGHREDVEPRCRKIQLAYYEENPNGRIFPNPYLHFWLKDNRFMILEAVKSLFDYWRTTGTPSGTTPFNSYPRWAEVVGGVMSVCGLGDPCLPHIDDEDLLGGDMREKAMRTLFELCYQDWPNQWLKKSDIWDILLKYQPNDELLQWFGDLNEKHRTSARLGKTLIGFNKRILNGIQLAVDTSKTRTANWEYYFERKP
jgi:hypothetical protein